MSSALLWNLSRFCYALISHITPREDFVNNSIIIFTGVNRCAPCPEGFWLSRTITTSPS